MTDERQSDNTARRDEAGQRTRPEGSPLSAVGSSGTAQGGDHHRTSPSAPLLPRTMSATAPAPPAEETPIRWRELFGVLSLIVLADVTIYRGEGFAGLALLFAAAVPLFWLSSPHGHRPTAFWVTGTMLLVLAATVIPTFYAPQLYV